MKGENLFGGIMGSQNLEMIVKMLRARKTEKIPPIEDMRAYLEKMGSFFPVAKDIVCEPVDANGIPAEWIIAPGAAQDLALLYLHGGGYTIGSINSHRHLASRLSKSAKVRVLAIDYRLAPEHPFPAALEDARAAYRWLLAQGFCQAKLAIAGDSAGGGLTMAVLVALRDEDAGLPAAAVCMSPWVDLAGTGNSMRTKAEVDPMVRQDGVRMMAKMYLGQADATTPLASPLYADLSGLPPLLIQVGTSEVLLDDAVRLAERAKSAGVNVTLEQWEDMIHVWQFFASMLPEGGQAIERIGQFIQAMLNSLFQIYGIFTD
jgi:monoterpene epsilon-lactone hydrolase